MAGAPPRPIAPEVVQTSAMDCGPASLKCLLEGFGIPVSYGRLREACQTDVDGTSIDTLEDVAFQLGLAAEQVVVPIDHVLLPEARCLPALAVVTQPSGATHFAVAWRRVGPWVQVMDPAVGRQWQRARTFLSELYRHSMPVPAAAWREWAGSRDFLGPLERRARDLGARTCDVSALVEEALADPGWRGPAVLDAAVRLVGALARAGAVGRGPEALRALRAFHDRALREDPARSGAIPASYWTVRPADPRDGEETLTFTGAVLLRVSGRRPANEEEAPAPLSPDLAAALAEPPARPGSDLVRLLREDGWLTPAALTGALALSGGTLLVEAVLFRALFELGRFLGPFEQRLAAVGAVVLFAMGLLVLDLGIQGGVLRMGRHLENRLRVAFLTKIPRLGDRYFRSRLVSDMAERSHAVHALRHLPSVAASLLRSAFGLVLTTAGIAWLDPGAAPLAVVAAALSVAVPLAAHPVLAERELRQRTHGGALSRLYLDALLGLVPVRTHPAERSLRREHEMLLVEWARAGFHLQRGVVAVDTLQALAGLVLAASLVSWHVLRHDAGGGLLLLVYWALQLPVLGEAVADAARQYPSQRNVTLRLIEPLGAPEEAPVEVPRAPAAHGPVAVRMEGVSVMAGGHAILRDVDLDVPAGSHAGIVGPSGAGKSSLVGLLLGWRRASAGGILVDGRPLDGAALAALRSRTAWVDPEVQVWNRSFADNLLYGNQDGPPPPISEAFDAADLRDVLECLPDGLQTGLGEGGGLLSGGQGQRVRLGRALLRRDAGLVILDEAFRGLDRERRGELLARARAWWRGATLLCITHDVGDTLGFERVVVIEDGAIAEAGDPRELVAGPGSRYGALVEAERGVRRGLWRGAAWRRLWLSSRGLEERTRAEDEA